MTSDAKPYGMIAEFRTAAAPSVRRIHESGGVHAGTRAQCHSNRVGHDQCFGEWPGVQAGRSDALLGRAAVRNQGGSIPHGIPDRGVA